MLNALSSLIRQAELVRTNPARLRELVEEVTSLLADERRESSNRLNGGVLLPSKGRYIIIGDLHGDLDTLEEILEKNDVIRRLDEKRINIVFLGDYIDRGNRQIETITLVMLLKKHYPENTVLLRGNHEPPKELPPYPHDFPYVLKVQYGIEGWELYNTFTKLFDELPYVAIVEGEILLMHGGPPTNNINNVDSYKEYLSLDTFPPRLEVLEEILWNDPAEHIEYNTPSPRGAGYLFGYKVTEKALNLTNTKIIVRGHEPANEGYKLNHNGRVVTLFTRHGPPYFNEKAAYMVVDTRVLNWYRDVEEWIRQI